MYTSFLYKLLWDYSLIVAYMNQAPRAIRYNLIVVYAGWPTVLEFLEFLELFWNFFGTGNILEKSHFFRLVLELFLNSEFLRSDFLAYNISGFPLFGSPIFEKIIPHLGSPCVLEKCENVLEMFCRIFFKNTVGHPDMWTRLHVLFFAT